MNADDSHSSETSSDLCPGGSQNPSNTGTLFPGLEVKVLGKFADQNVTARGEKRAEVPFVRLDTLWLNTGSLCNIACDNCYIETSPPNDCLSYLTRADVRRFLDECSGFNPPPQEIGITGGEPFMNPHTLGIIEDSLIAGYSVLVLTNAMRPMLRLKADLRKLNERFPGRMTLRVSLDHYTAALHERLRGSGSWTPAIEGLQWLHNSGFCIAIAAALLIS